MAAGEIERDGRSQQVAYQHYVDGVPWKELAAAAGYSSVAACRHAANLWLRQLNDLNGLGIPEEIVDKAELAAMNAEARSTSTPFQRRFRTALVRALRELKAEQDAGKNS